MEKVTFSQLRMKMMRIKARQVQSIPHTFLSESSCYLSYNSADTSSFSESAFVIQIWYTHHPLRQNGFAVANFEFAVYTTWLPYANCMINRGSIFLVMLSYFAHMRKCQRYLHHFHLLCFAIALSVRTYTIQREMETSGIMAHFNRAFRKRTYCMLQNHRDTIAS